MMALWIVVAVLAAYRLTVLVVYDEITRPLREQVRDLWLQPREDHAAAVAEVDKVENETRITSIQCACGVEFTAPVDARILWKQHVAEQPTRHPRLAVLVECPWCVSVWMGALVAATGLLWAHCTWWQIIAGGLAIAAVAGPVAVYLHPPKADE